MLRSSNSSLAGSAADRRNAHGLAEFAYFNLKDDDTPDFFVCRVVNRVVHWNGAANYRQLWLASDARGTLCAWATK